MSKYTVRVQLTGSPPEETYEKLHAAMESAGFIRTITSDKGNTYILPHAEYNLEGDPTFDEVLELAKAAAGTVDKNAKILVTESARRTWHNLDPAD